MESLAQVTVQLKGALSESLFIIGPVVKKIGLVMCGGSLGAASRYGISLLSVRVLGTGFPWGTLIVNLLGCFLIGVLFTLAARARLLTPDMRLLLITGYMGALTTFSTFALETVSAGRGGMLLQSLANVLANNVGGIACTFFGIWVASLIR